MRARTYVLSITMMLGAIAQFLGSPPSKATEPTYRRALLPESHRSTSGVHKLLVLSEDNVALTRLTSAGTVLRILDYNSFRVAFVTDQAMPLLAETDLRRVRVRDDYDLIALNGWSIDTRLGEPSDLPTDRKQSPAQYPWQLYVVQFVGPPRDEWLAELTALDDVQVISYLATNAYLVRATPAAWARVDSEAGRGSGTLQWAGVYHPAYRIAQGLDPAIVDGAVAVDVVVQILDTPEGRMATESIRRDAMAALDDVPPLNGLRNVRVRLLASSLPALAHEPEVTWIEPWLQPRASDERQAQIVANNVTTISNEEQPSGVGYWSWLQGQNLTCPTGASQCTTGYFSGFSVDVSDGGFDLGSTSNVISPDFKTPGGLSRILYARTYVGGSASDSNGHGTLSAATVGGYNINADDESRDATLYQYGLGIAPSVRLGISKMIGSSSFSTVIADAYASEARISNNSWNAAIPDNTYDTTAQTYDLLVRDARSNQGGNQEMTIVFAASNFGPGVSTVTRPATAKNVISVGASEGFRKTLGTVAKPDGCGVDGESDDAKDIASFSSRGPTHDGRKKPDLVAPGTRITGAASRTICDAGPNPPSSCDDVLPDPDCNVSPPPCCPECLLGCGFIRDPLTTTRKHIVVGGTSFAAPAVSGAAALVRQFFRTRSPAAWTPDPSPAMTKAFLTATATYLTGDGANDTLPSNSQGYGRLNLGRAFDATPNRRVDQTTVFDAAGQTYTIATSVADAAKPVRIVLAWTDRYGPTFGNAWVNDLDLEVILEEPGGDVLQFQGNQFAGAKSECVEIIGVPPARTDCVASLIPDVRNNAEAVFMPAGTTGSLTITVRALTIVGDGVPGVGDMTDQDFALFVYNATP